MTARVALLLGAILAGCAAQPSRTSSVNLSGFTPAFQQGYADGCDSASPWRPGTRDEQRFKADTQYAQGWRDGFSVCKGR